MNTQGYIVGMIAIMIMTTVILGLALYKSQQRIASLERRYDVMTQHEGSKSGGTSLLTGEPLNYNLRTFDSGKTWYAVELDRDWGMTILGESEVVYPGLLDHIKAIDRLTQHVQDNGPIGVDDIQLLEDAGFKVERK